VRFAARSIARDTTPRTLSNHSFATTHRTGCVSARAKASSSNAELGDRVQPRQTSSVHRTQQHAAANVAAHSTRCRTPSLARTVLAQGGAPARQQKNAV
jgi:hypothetical protein